MIDFHYHIECSSVQRQAFDLPAGCIVAQHSDENALYDRIADVGNVACALFAHPRSPDWERTLELVSKGKRLAYKHLELFDSHDLCRARPVLAASERRGFPVVVHLSRHDRQFFSGDDARRSLEAVLMEFPTLRIIVSHCGGENVGMVARVAHECPRMLLDTSRLLETSRRSGFHNIEAMLSMLMEQIEPSQLLYGSDRSWPLEPTNESDMSVLRAVYAKDHLDRVLTDVGESLFAAIRMTQTNSVAAT
jgi:predicted TIM-barrel fold metal-dependent hydrolase